MKPSRKLLITGILFLLIALTYFSYNYWIAPTRIAIVNALPAQSSDILLNNNNRNIKIDLLQTEEIKSLDKYNAVVIFGRGLYLDEEKQTIIKKASDKGTVFLTISTPSNSTIINNNISKEQHIILLKYFNNKTRQNYQNGINFLSQIACPHKLTNKEFVEPIILPQDLFYHLEYGKYFKTTKEIDSYLKEKKLYQTNGKKIALLSGIHFPVEGNRAHIDTLISKLSREGFNVYPLSSLNKREEMIKDLHPDAVIYIPMGRLGNDKFIDWLHTENIPLFCPFPLVQERETWLDPTIPVSGGSLTARILVPEIDGAMAPLVIATQNPNKEGYYAHEPEPERINNFVSHLAKYLKLKDKPNSEKRLAICYFKNPGKDALIASGMEVAPSLYKFLNTLKEKGYNLNGLPSTFKEFEKLLYLNGSVMGSYAKGAQEIFLSTSNPVWIKKDQYESWVKEVIKPEKYAEIIERYGEAPGQLLVRHQEDDSEIAIASLHFGNVLLYPQARPALGDDDFKLVHGVPVAPPHSYIAPYLYMQKGFKAHALIHFGTHGNLEFTPGKNVALSNADWADVLVGDLPHFYFYTTGNVGEGIIAKRRTHAALVTHLTPPFVESGMREKYNTLLANIHKLLGEGLNNKNQNLALSVKNEIVKQGLHRDLGLDSVLTKAYSLEELEIVDSFAEEIVNEKIMGAFYVLGEPYSERDLLTTSLAVSADPLAYSWAKSDRDNGKITTKELQNYSFISHRYLDNAKNRLKLLLQKEQQDTIGLEAELKNAIQYRKLLKESSSNEICAILRGLEGGSIFPTPGGDPVLNPNVLPTGRNMFSINAEMTPTTHSWEDGVRLAKSTLEQYLKKHKSYPRKINYTFWAGEFINSEGATIAQALYMLGVEPIRDKMGRAVDLKLISSEELGRPRINVVVQISGQLRDIAGSRLKLLTEAIQLASESNDDLYPNYVASGSLLQEKLLVEKGISPKLARKMSHQRIFGPINSGYSTGMLSYTESSGSWDDEKELANGYLNNMGAIYGDDENWGDFHPNLLEAALSETDLLIQPRQSNTWGPISLDHVYEFMGGASLAIKHTTGKEPEAFMVDYRNRNNKRIQNLKEAVAIEVRATILNTTFIQERMKGGATTAHMFGEIFRNIFGWNTMRKSAIDVELYNDLYKMYILDEKKLGIYQYFKEQNPAAFQEMSSVMLESARKGYWQASNEQLKQTAKLHAQIIDETEVACTRFVCDNAKLEKFITQLLNEQDSKTYLKNMQTIRETTSKDNKTVTLKRESLSQHHTDNEPTNYLLITLFALTAFIFLLLIITKKNRQRKN